MDRDRLEQILGPLKYDLPYLEEAKIIVLQTVIVRLIEELIRVSESE